MDEAEVPTRVRRGYVAAYDDDGYVRLGLCEPEDALFEEITISLENANAGGILEEGQPVEVRFYDIFLTPGCEYPEAIALAHPSEKVRKSQLEITAG